MLKNADEDEDDDNSCTAKKNISFVSLDDVELKKDDKGKVIAAKVIATGESLKVGGVTIRGTVQSEHMGGVAR